MFTKKLPTYKEVYVDGYWWQVLEEKNGWLTLYRSTGIFRSRKHYKIKKRISEVF